MSAIIVKIYTPQELNHSSYIQTGLFELEKDSYLKTDVVLSFAKRLGTIRVTDSGVEQTKQPHPKTSFYQLVDAESGNIINFATDLYDASDSFSEYALKQCDYVFKRNFEAKYVEQLPEEFQQKIFPLGLTFGCHSKYKKDWNTFYIGFWITNFKLNFKIDSYFFQRLKRGFNFIKKHWKFINTSRFIADFESYKAINDSEKILFQTRCFTNEEQEDVAAIHLQRYKIITVLKQKFKSQFMGGFISSPIALKNYSDAISNLPAEPLEYLKEVKKTKIVIYTRGLVNSPAWKMAEYLSQGKIIIAEKVTAELSVSLTHGKEVLFFEDEKEMVSLIEEALEDDLLCEKLSKNSKYYFDTHVHPKANVKRIINFMLSQKS